MTGVEVSYKRSPFCLVHWEGRDVYARNCNDRRIFRLGERSLDILRLASEWTPVPELASALEAQESKVQRAADRLVEMGLVVTDPPGAGNDGRDGPGAASWDLIDLALQRKSARGGFDPDSPPVGPPPPALKSTPGPAIGLERADLDAGLSFQAVLEARRSVRTYADEPLALGELGRFLYHAARVTRRPRAPGWGALTHRPSPSAGSCHPLEIYPVCNAVAGLEPGAYHYDPGEHTLRLVRPADAWQEEITRHARASTGNACNRDPAVILVVSAVFQRTMWKYQNISLALILKDVGALYQTMYLVATALGLAPCALGGWLEEENARWLGLDPLAESQVGGFLLGYPDHR